MGIFEIEQSSARTFAVAKLVAEYTATSIIGGGDSGKAIKASLEFLEGTPLPGIVALMN
jgi:phosphoglycerate kinase